MHEGGKTLHHPNIFFHFIFTSPFGTVVNLVIRRSTNVRKFPEILSVLPFIPQYYR